MRPLPLQPGASGGTYIPPEDTFEVKTAAPAVRFLTQAVQPPSNVYVEADDILQCNCASSQTGETVTVSYRLLKASGDLVNGQFSVSPPNNRAVSQHSEQLAEGFLLSMSCRAAVATTRGQTFVRLFLTGPELGQSQPSYMLMADYVTTQMAPGHPNGRTLSPSEGPGNIRALTSIPVANVEFAFIVPGNARWRPLSLHAELLTDATVGNRSAGFVIGNGAITFWDVLTLAAIPASTQAHTSMSGAGVDVTGTVGSTSYGIIALPTDLRVLSSGILQSNQTVFVGPADQWINVGLQVEEWLDNV